MFALEISVDVGKCQLIFYALGIIYFFFIFFKKLFVFLFTAWTYDLKMPMESSWITQSFTLVREKNSFVCPAIELEFLLDLSYSFEIVIKGINMNSK